MKTQIYCIVSVEEALNCIAAGADHIGIAPGYEGILPSGISLDKGKQIFDAIGEKAVKVALTIADDPEEIYPMISYLQPDIVHLCGDTYYATEEFCRRAKELVPGIEIMQAIGVGQDPAVIELAKKYAYCDYLILDSVVDTIPGIGAVGVTHDWNISAEIVRQVPCKIILAGGLGPDNVKEAISVVHPYGVDSLTKTSTDEPRGKRKKDIKKVALFCKNAHEAEMKS